MTEPLVELPPSSRAGRACFVLDEPAAEASSRCVIRVGALHDSRLIARRIGRCRGLNHASPDCLAAHGMPATLDDLDRPR